MIDLTLAGTVVEVRGNVIQALPEVLRPVAQDVAGRGLQSTHFEGRLSSEMSKIVLAVAAENDLQYDQASKFPGFERLQTPLQLWLDFVLLSRLGIDSYRDLVNRTAVICYPYDKRLKLRHLMQPVGSLPIVVLHGCRQRLLLRIYKAQPGECGLEIGESCNTAARDLSMLPGVPPFLDLAARRGYEPRARVAELLASGKCLEDARAAMRMEALAKAQPTIESLRLRGLEYDAFPPAKAPRASLCDESFMRIALYALRIWRDAMRAERLRKQIGLLCRQHSATRSEALTQPGRLGRDESKFREMTEERRELLRTFRTSGPVLPDYLVEFRTSDVAGELRAQAVSTDEESTLLPADLVNRTDSPAKSYRLAIAVHEEWSYVAQWETRCRPISSLRFADAYWHYRFSDEPEGSTYAAAPDEFSEQFHWTPKPLAIHRAHNIEPEDLQYCEHVSADLSATKFDDSRWR